jgi:hypothetical protein
MSAIRSASAALLMEIGLLPYELLPHLLLKHGSDDQKKIERAKINGGIPKTQGIYIYAQNDNVLYVGEAVNLRRRIHQHFNSSVFIEQDGRKGSAGDKENGDWSAFFRDQCKGPVTVHWKEIPEHEDARKSLEKLLQWIIEPTFVPFRDERRKVRTTAKRIKARQVKLLKLSELKEKRPLRE